MIFESVKRVHVFLLSGSSRMAVGQLGYVDRRLFFEYDLAFISSGLLISPFKLPLKFGAVTCPDIVFEGLFGVFNDSLPDGWGRLLLDRQVRKYGLASELLTPLDRLAHVGRFGMGALLYEPDYSSPTVQDASLSLDQIASDTQQTLEGDASIVFEALLGLSGSSAGARPKAMLGISADKQQLLHGQQELPSDFEHWMVKFASRSDSDDAGALEYAYSCMAQRAGVEMMPTYLFPSKKGGGYFGVQRFDRRGNQRRHMHTLSGLLHADHRLPSLDYELVLRATLALTKSAAQVEKMYRLAAFNVLAHNRDDHAKNFSFLMDADGQWSAAPAYDLTFSSGPGGEHSTTIMGEGREPTFNHLRKLAEKFGITAHRANAIADEVQTAIGEWKAIAKNAGVSKSSIATIGKVILRP
jgi:serine/threonine-protein kinase HipA